MCIKSAEWFLTVNLYFVIYDSKQGLKLFIETTVKYNIIYVHPR